MQLENLLILLTPICGKHSHHKSFIQHENKSPMKVSLFKRTKQSRETESISLNQTLERLITQFINLVKSDISILDCCLVVSTSQIEGTEDTELRNPFQQIRHSR